MSYNPFDELLVRLERIEQKLHLQPDHYTSTPQNQAPEIVDTDTLCKRLNITEPTLLTYRKKGKIPFLKIGSSIRFNYDAVIKALENKKAK